MKINIKKLTLAALVVASGAHSFATQAMFEGGKNLKRDLLMWGGSMVAAYIWATVSDDMYQYGYFLEYCKSGNVEQLRRDTTTMRFDCFSKYICHNNCEALKVALDYNHFEIAQFLLEYKGVDLACNDYKAVLHALKTNEKAMVKLFFDHLSKQEQIGDMQKSVNRVMDLEGASKAVREEVNNHIYFYGLNPKKKKYVNDSLFGRSAILKKFMRTEFNLASCRLNKHDYCNALKALDQLGKAVFDGNVESIEQSDATLLKILGEHYAINEVYYNNEPLVYLAVRHNQFESLKALCDAGFLLGDYKQSLLAIARNKGFDASYRVLEKYALKELLANVPNRSQDILGGDIATNITSFLCPDSYGQNIVLEKKQDRSESYWL